MKSTTKDKLLYWGILYTIAAVGAIAVGLLAHLTESSSWSGTINYVGGFVVGSFCTMWMSFGAPLRNRNNVKNSGK